MHAQKRINLHDYFLSFFGCTFLGGFLLGPHNSSISCNTKKSPELLQTQQGKGNVSVHEHFS